MPPTPTSLSLRYPFAGRWLVQNSPANRVPSHGTTAFASSHAIDFVPVTAAGISAPVTGKTLLRPEPAAQFTGFGRPILAPVSGTVVASQSDAPDHSSHRGAPSIFYALTQHRRVSRGWTALAGNHVMIQLPSGAVVALCHLRQDSVLVDIGAAVDAGQPIAGCGNSGNSTEPHLHIQAMSSADVASARPLALSFGGLLPHNGEIISAPGDAPDMS